MDTYKEKYNEALERARKLKENPQSVFNEYSPKEGDTICDYIFPELAESEDERIREIDPYFMTKYIDKGKELTCKDIEIILGIENNILHECNDNSQLVIEAYPKGEDYYGEILRRFNNQRIKPQRMISAEAKEALYNKPACVWSEEDEVYLNTTIAYLKDAQEFKKTAENCIDWLKTLKQRIGG